MFKKRGQLNKRIITLLLILVAFGIGLYFLITKILVPLIIRQPIG